LVFALLAPLLGTGNTAKAFSQYKRTSPFLQKRFRTFAYFRISNRFDMHFARLFDSNKHLFLALPYGVSPKANIFEREHNTFFHSLFNRTKMITAPRQKIDLRKFSRHVYNRKQYKGVSVQSLLSHERVQQYTAEKETRNRGIMAQTLTGRAARLEDVAALAGVSLATASKALHNKPRISEETKQRVLDAAKQLNYSPNKLAQSLARGTTGTIGLVTSDLQGRFSTPILIGAENELRAQSTSVLLANARGDAALERQHVEKLLSLKVDGLLIVQCETNPRPTLGHDWGVPLVYVYGPSTDPKDCSVTCDNVDAGRMAINHLISCGRRHIAIIGGDETYTAATDRTKGALEALSELGIEPAGPIRYGKWDEGWGRAATRLLLDQGVKFDAVVCQNDQLARGCIDVLKQQGLRIPDDVAVIGHDNWSVLTSSSRPALTSIDNETETIGRRAARYLVDAIDGNPHHGVDYVPCHLIQRESTLPLD
jgi:LacI family transcriptional regulator